MSRDDVQTAERAPLFSLASLLASYPGEDFGERLALLRHGLHGEASLPDCLALTLETLADPSTLEERRTEFLSVLERQGSPLRETSYGRMRGPGIGRALAEIAAYYSAFGVRCGNETVDFLGVELEFYAFMLVKEAHLVAERDDEGVTIVADARRSFLTRHLAPLVLAATRSVTDELFRPTFAFIAELVARECSLANVIPEPLEVGEELRDDGPVVCGSPALPIVE